MGHSQIQYKINAILFTNSKSGSSVAHQGLSGTA